MPPSRRIVRAALTETINAYEGMPTTTAGLPALGDRLEDIRRANVAHHIELMEIARLQDVRIICFGELFTAPYFAVGTDSMWIPMAEDAQDGATARELKEAARRLEMFVIAPLYELDGQTGRRYNAAVLIDEEGRFVGKYRKSHIPFGGNEQGEFHENFYYDRSNSDNGKSPANISQDPLFPVFKTSLGNIGIAICYDRHFPYAMWSLAQQGAELVFSPAITFGSKSERMWEVEFPTDAARHNLFIGGSNRRGQEPPWNQPFFGRSYFVGPNGTQPNISSHGNLIIADIDLDSLGEPDPSGWNLPRDSRPDYSLGAYPRQ